LLDFTPLRNKEITIDEMCRNLTPDDLRDLTNEMIDTVLHMTSECQDEDVTFVPEDPKALDNAAATDAELHMPWTLGHIIVHITASAEEAAFLAAEMARGIKREGRSRSEVYWTTITSLAQCRERLEESRRMRLASLDVWPDKPYMDTTTQVSYLEGPINPVARFVLGLRHDTNHLDQISDVVSQARAARA
jgi:hypothetical protein